MDTKNNNHEQPNATGGTGRTYNSGQEGNAGAPKEPVSNDISDIDQQEGAMNNGVVGGDMGTDTGSDNSGSEPDKPE